MNSSMMLMIAVFGMVWLSGAACNSDSSKDGGEEEQAVITTIPVLDVNILHRLDVVPCTLTSTLQANDGVRGIGVVFYNFMTFRHFCLLKSLTHVDHIFKGHPLYRLNIPIEPEKTAKNTYKPFAYERHNIQCPSNKRCRLEMEYMDLQERVTIGSSKICLDYLLIENPTTNSKTELCGNETLNNYEFNNTLYITFRSGYTEQKGGFKIQVKTFSTTAMSNEEECLKQQQDVLMQGEDLYTGETRQQYVPDGAKELLERFYSLHNKRALAYSIDSYHYILRIAAISERSCNQETAAIAQDVLSLFSGKMVEQARENVFNGN